ncbi:MAG TPA: LuxR C-terminal-related transcriptional regulator, partial [Anaerolineales bacterium]
SSIESLLTTLLNEIDAVPHDFLLVLDDYHLLDSKAVDQALTFLVEHIPQKMHLVITSREDPALPVARLRARHQLTELRAADLRFTPAEASEFLNQVMGLHLPAEDIAALEARTEGWIAGLQLAAISLQGHSNAADFIRSFTGAHRFVLDYLLEEVLHQQPEPVQAFLLRTSILNRLSGPLCDAVLLDPSAPGQETLESLERANLFLIPLDDERHWYRYHHLFGDLLRQRQGQNLKPEEIAAYHIRASEWYEQNDDPSEAFHHAMAARDFDRAARLTEIAWERMDESFQSAAWLGWVKQLPEELIRTRPVLCTQIAWAFMDLSEVDASESRLQDAERCLEAPSDGMVIVEQEQFHALPARIAFVRAYNAQTRGDLTATIKFAEQAIHLAPGENHFLRAQAAAILGATYWASGDLEAACRSMSDWIDRSQKSGNFIFAIASGSGKADILTAQGHLREALRTYQESLQLASAHEKEAQRITAHHHLGLAMLHHEMGDDKAAASCLQRSLELGEQSTLLDWPYRRCIAQARLKESQGDLSAACDLLEEARGLYIKTLIPDSRPVGAIMARVHLKQGQLSRAQEWARERGISVNDELSYLHEFEHITLARVLLAEYQNDREGHSIEKALTLLERLLKAAESQKRTGSILQILVVQALAFQAQGDIPRALESLEGALTLAQPEGYVRIFVDEGLPMAALLREVAKQGIASNYVHQLQAAFGKTDSSAGDRRPVSQALIEPLSERELDVLRLLRTELDGPEIARALQVSLNTMRTHTKNIYNKLGVNTRRAAIRRAEELDLF